MKQPDWQTDKRKLLWFLSKNFGIGLDSCFCVEVKRIPRLLQFFSIDMDSNSTSSLHFNWQPALDNLLFLWDYLKDKPFWMYLFQGSVKPCIKYRRRLTDRAHVMHQLSSQGWTNSCSDLIIYKYTIWFCYSAPYCLRIPKCPPSLCSVSKELKFMKVYIINWQQQVFAVQQS